MSLKKYILRILVCAPLTLSVGNFCVAQDNAPSDMELADEYLEAADYASAWKLYMTLFSKEIQDPLLLYKIGICYFHSPNHNSRKAREYFELAQRHNNGQVPEQVHYYLGRCYHRDYRFIDAINAFNRYIDELDKKNLPDTFGDTKRWIEMCEDGERYLKRPKNQYLVQVIDYPVNTSYREYAPLISNDRRMLIFSSDRPDNTVQLVLNDEQAFLLPTDAQQEEESVFTSFRRGLDWGFPLSGELRGRKITTLSLSSDNSMLLLSIAEEGQEYGDLYISEHKRGKWGNPRKISGKINSKYEERGACFSESGNAIYFASNRPGGLGGFDLYRSTRAGKDWGEPENLGAQVNSPQNEINPFVHPDTRSLYFSSDQKGSMGGLDIFLSDREDDGSWSLPRNLGYPINSVFDDDYFTQVPDEQYSYLSSNRIDNTQSLGGHDIVSIFKPRKEVALTMLTGSMKVQQGDKKLPAYLKVTDLGTNAIERYVYDPDTVSGNYVAILRPARSYRLAVEVSLGEGKSPVEIATVDLDIPENTYSYEFSQEIYLNEYKLFGKVVGKLPNSITKASSIRLFEQMPKDTTELRYDALGLLLQYLVNNADTEGWLRLNELEDPRNAFPEDARFAQDDMQRYNKLFDMVGEAFEKSNAEILTDMMNPITSNKLVFTQSMVGSQEGRTLLAHTLALSENTGKLSDDQLSDFEEVCSFLENNAQISLKINGYGLPASQGAYNSVLDQLQQLFQRRGISPERISFGNLQPLANKEGNSGLLVEVSLFGVTNN